MYIKGEWATANGVLEVTNPANGEVIGTVPDGSREDAARAIEAAAKAFPAWSGLTAYQRSDYLYRAHRIMMERREDLARMMTLEQGKPIRAARNEVGYAADFLLWYAEEAKRVYGETIPAPRGDQRFIVAHQPVGVVARGDTVELSDFDADAENRTGAGGGMHHRAEAGRGDSALRRGNLQGIRGGRNPSRRRQSGDGGRSRADRPRSSSPTRRCARSPSPARPRSARSWPPVRQRN